MKESYKQKIQKDLDAGKFNQICSNETTFKDYVFPIIDKTEKQAQKDILKPLIDISYNKTSAEVIGGQLYAMVKLLRENNKS